MDTPCVTDPVRRGRFFPNLDAHKWDPTSERDGNYNCLAWIFRDKRHWWWPSAPSAEKPIFWPLSSMDESLTTFRRLLAARGGFERCDGAELEPGWEKVAIYVDADDMPQHFARQLPAGDWTSKLGVWEDIRHATLAALEGDGEHQYGRARYFMKRRRDGRQA
jgi:hypothetical protein